MVWIFIFIIRFIFIFFRKVRVNKVNELRDVDLFDVYEGESFSDCNYGYEIRVPLYALDKHKNIISGQNILDIIQNDCEVNLSQKDFQKNWTCIIFMKENKNAGFVYESVFYKLPETLTVESVEDGTKVIKRIAKVKNIYGLRYYFLPRQQLVAFT